MKHRLLSFAIIAITAFGNAATLYSQNYVGTPVTISNEKVRIGGKVFYSHVVLEKQTIFALSKAYEVPVDDIYKYNPSLSEMGLKKNAIVLIPVINSSSDKKAQTYEVTPKDAAEIKSEEVVCQPRNVEAKADNKVSATEKQTDKSNDEQTHQKKEQKHKTHVVRWLEDLDSIAEKYDVSVESIMKLNNLKGRKLTRKQKLLIPSEDNIKDSTEIEPILEEQAETTQKKTLKQSSKIAEETQSEDANDSNSFKKNIFRKNKTKISILLPLKADGVKSSKNNMDFYAGTLIAAQELGEEGINLELDVYDINNIEQQIDKEQLNSSDVVIGPVSSGDISNILNLVSGGCHLVSPLDPRAEKLAETNWNLIQAPTPHKVLYEDLGKWIKEELCASDSIIFINERGGRDAHTYSLMRAAADSAGLKYQTFSYSILEGRDIQEPLAGLMTSQGMNRFIVASESEAFVNDVVRNLNLLIHNKYNVTLYAPAKIRSFETMEIENLHNTNLHICLGYYIDYNDNSVRNFLMKFRALYNTEPSQYAFQGYDILKYYVRLCHKYGSSWPEVLEDDNEKMLQSTFKFKRQENGGWVNEGVRRIVYEKNWSVRKN